MSGDASGSGELDRLTSRPPTGPTYSRHDAPGLADTEPPTASNTREVAERTAEALLNLVPIAGGTLAVLFSALAGRKLQKRRDAWLRELAEVVQWLSEHGLDPETLADNDLFVDAVVSTSRMIEHTHQEEKIQALRNAVLNSVAPDAPDADTQAIFLDLLDRFTPSHLRILTYLDDPPGWFRSHGLQPPQGIMAGSRLLGVKAGLPEMAERDGFVNLLVSELSRAGFLKVDTLSGMVSGQAIMDALTSEFGRQFLRYVTVPQAEG
jgi:hypothetical protein